MILLVQHIYCWSRQWKVSQRRKTKKSFGDHSLGRFYIADTRKLPVNYNWVSKFGRHRQIRKKNKKQGKESSELKHQNVK